MLTQSEPKKLHALSLRLSNALGWIIFSVGILVMLAWILNLGTVRNLVQGFAAMKFNTALCFSLMGAGILAHRKKKHQIVLLIAGLIGLLAGLTLLQYPLHSSFGIDQLFVKAKDDAYNFGRMSPASASSFCCMALSLIALELKKYRIFQAGWFGSFVIGFIGVVAYINKVQPEGEISWISQMAVHTAVLHVCAGLALGFLKPGYGLMSIIFSADNGGRLARNILPVGILVPWTFSFLRQAGQAAGLFTEGGGRVFTACLFMLLISTLVLLTAKGINKSEAEKKEVAARNAFLAAIVDSSEDAIISKTVDGIITSWNKGAQKIYGYTEEEIIGQSINTLSVPGLEGEIDEILSKIRAGEVVDHFETVRRKKNGDLLQVSITVSPILDRDGRVVGASASARDITALKESEELFRVATESSPAGIVIVNAEGEIVLINNKVEEFFGYSAEELIGQKVDQLVPHQFKADHPKFRQEYLEDPSQRLMGVGRDLFGLRKDGTQFPVEVGLSPVQMSSGMHVLGMVLDITERKKAYESLELYAEELKRSNAELEQFAYIASHDLQEPLRMVVSYMQLFEKRYAEQIDEKADKYIRYAVDGAQRMQKLVNDLLVFSRVGSQGKKLLPVSSQKVLEQTLHGLQHVIQESKTQMVYQDLPEVLADETQLGQIFQNLIGNAVKFRSEREPVIQVRAESKGNYWRFEIEDNGMGIDEQYSERIFQMFQRLHERGQYEGSGIGLAVAKKIVERHGGQIGFHSKLDQGTTFYFTLPKAATETANARDFYGQTDSSFDDRRQPSGL